MRSNFFVQDPTDTAYVHSVYAPITIRLVESFSKPGGWRAIEDVLKNLLPEATVEEVSLPRSCIDQVLFLTSDV